MPRYKEPMKITGIMAGHNCHYKPTTVVDCKHEKTFMGVRGRVCSICGEKLGEDNN